MSDRIHRCTHGSYPFPSGKGVKFKDYILAKCAINSGCAGWKKSTPDVCPYVWYPNDCPNYVYNKNYQG